MPANTPARSKAGQHLNFSLLSDSNKEASKKYGSLYDRFGYDMPGVSRRSAFLIDREGVVQYGGVLENDGEQPGFKAIRQRLHEVNV